MFYLDNKDTNGNWNNIQIERLKDKVGTRQLPTAELLLDGSIATKVCVYRYLSQRPVFNCQNVSFRLVLEVFKSVTVGNGV